MGLGLVKDRLGDAEGAVSVLQAAVTHYRRVYGEDGSTLIAKALTSLGRCKELINKDEEAGAHFEEVGPPGVLVPVHVCANFSPALFSPACTHTPSHQAVRIFDKRAGKGPLLAGALGHLGKNQLKRQQYSSATASLFSAVELEVQKDALDLNLIWELIEAIKTCWIGLLNTKKM